MELICFLSSMHPEKDKRVFEKEALSLYRAGYKVTHLCPGDDFSEKEERGVFIRTYPKPSGVIDRIFKLFRLYTEAKRINADVYHCNEVDSWFIGVLLKIFSNKKCVFDVHEHYPSTFAESYFPIKMQPIVSSGIKAFYWILTPLTDYFVLAKKTVSDDFYCHKTKKILVRNFTPITGVRYAQNRIQPKETDTITFLHLGMFNKIRGWPQILDAMRLMENKNFCLKIIGEFNDGSRTEFENTLKKYDLEKKVVVHDWMPFQKAFELLKQAHIGLIIFQPTRLNNIYAMPHKMFDYMAAGMAVICPEFAIEVAPIVEKTGCGVLVDTSNPIQLAEQLDNLITNPEKLHKMGQKGQEAVREKYNWEFEEKKLLDMYKKWNL